MFFVATDFTIAHREIWELHEQLRFKCISLPMQSLSNFFCFKHKTGMKFRSLSTHCPRHITSHWELHVTLPSSIILSPLVWFCCPQLLHSLKWFITNHNSTDNLIPLTNKKLCIEVIYIFRLDGWSSWSFL